jgi:hypothetical protein
MSAVSAAPDSTPDNDMLAPDPITGTSVSKNPCEVMSFSGYLGYSSSGTHVRIYDDLALRTWITIPADAIKHREVLDSVDGIQKSLIWVNIRTTVFRCQAIEVSNESHMGVGIPLGDEDLKYGHPR